MRLSKIIEPVLAQQQIQSGVERVARGRREIRRPNPHARLTLAFALPMVMGERVVRQRCRVDASARPGTLAEMGMIEDTSTRSWNDIADDWVLHSDANDYRNHYLMPRLLALLGQVGGKSMLDLGCGEGGYARELARRGARVTAVDGSARLIEVARRRACAEGVDVRFIHANANALPDSESGQFDVVVAPMSLMDVEDYRGAIAEVQRVLRRSGELVMSITHPCFSAPVSRWIRDGDTLQTFIVDRYFERIAWAEKIAPGFRAPVLRRHRPLEDYMAAPLDCGLRLQGFMESNVTDEELQHSHRFRKLRRIPYFLFMRWIKE